MVNQSPQQQQQQQLLDSPLYAFTPLSDDGSKMTPVQTVHAASGAASLHSHTSRKSTSSMLKNDDDAFVSIASALMERRRVKNLSVANAIDATLLPHERRAFWEALHFRKSQLPMFAEANESTRNELIRDVERTFGSALRDSTDMTSPSASPTKQSSPFQYADSRSPTSQMESTRSVHSTTMRTLPNGGQQQQIPQTVMTNAGRPSPIMSPSSQQSPWQTPPSPRNASPRNTPGFSQSSFPTMTPSSPHNNHRQQQQPQAQTQEFHPPASPRNVAAYNNSNPPQQQQQSPIPNEQSSYQGSAGREQVMPGSHQYQQHAPPPRLVSRGSTASSETQQMQNSGRRGRSQQYQPYQQHNKQSPSLQTNYQLYDDNDQRHQQQQYRQPLQYQQPHQQQYRPPMYQQHALSPPLYKQYRPPDLQIQPVAASTAPPQHIDIDWNIPVQVVNEATPMKEKKTIRFVDQHQQQDVHSVSPKLTSVLKKKSAAPSEAPTEPSSSSSDTPSPPQPTEEQETQSSGLDEKMVAHTSLDDSAVSRTKVTEHPLGEKEAATKPSQAYRSDIARGKRALLLFNDEADSLVSVNQQYDMRMKLTDEIDRISNHVGKLSSEKRVAEEKAAYEEYLVELRVELYKWVRSYEYGRQSLAVSSQNDSLLGGSLEIDGSTDMKTAHSFLSDKGSTVGSKVDHHESDKQKRSIPRQIKATDQFPDVRKQWKMVNVMAPYTLPEGFQFEARIRDEIFTATVPRGGVTQGEVFATRMGDVYGDTGNAAQRTRVFKDMDAPPSRWRDELFDCFHHGLDHHFLWNSLLCPHVALSQVMARIQISDTGEPQYTIRSRTRVWWYALFSFFLMAVHATFACFFIIAEPDDDALLMATCPLIGLDVSVILYFYYMLIKTRRIVRREYDIPELRCHGNEDCCLSVFCTCCTLSQMGRHTADYETYRSYCCTDTGMAKHIEVKLPSDFLDDIEEGNNSAASGGGPDFLNYTKDLH